MTIQEGLPARLLAIATLQILASSTQFTGVQPISLNTLSDVAAAYLGLLAKAARANADHSGRNQINARDISDLLEHLDGPGALSGLLNYSIASSNQNQNHQTIDKLDQLAKNLKEFNHSPSLQPTTTLSFLPLTDAEIIALDRAGESDCSPSTPSSSFSSEEEGEPEPEPEPEENTPVIETTTPWRLIQDIPPYVPAHLPPFPGLERTISHPEPEPEPEPEQQPQEEEEIRPSPIIQQNPIPSSANQNNPYLVAIPFSKSQLYEAHGPSFLRPTHHSTRSIDQQEESSTPNKKIKLRNESIEGFLETYGYMVEEKITNENREEEEGPKLMRRNPIRNRLISTDLTEPIESSIIGSIPISSIRSNRWSAGWIAHPPKTSTGKLVYLPELKPYGHSPLPRIQLDAHGHTFTLISRLTRLGPPSELGESGEPLPYKIKDYYQQLVPSSSSNTDQAGNTHPSNQANQPKYLEWGFHWPPHEGRDPLPTPPIPTISDFKEPPFPGMPKTTAQKLKIHNKDK
ncbi:hypothetical protein Pst134EA_017288 [Puccinia striiformis f. sp. tritici]|uniref:hypothetical protein n=1 Tax=Puccinia striiformis f. sp. tritici TaxID=168172 RepID=UPI0020089A2D|nr:hypothetical protein Pst134EA_017288 [Puccinia striiformis f. sp. tritici]KAH9460980.1 hypothetical protein Pst134EA_017288 [Puccinia striiformis f. sp. tritici]